MDIPTPRPTIGERARERCAVLQVVEGWSGRLTPRSCAHNAPGCPEIDQAVCFTESGLAAFPACAATLLGTAGRRFVKTSSPHPTTGSNQSAPRSCLAESGLQVHHRMVGMFRAFTGFGEQAADVMPISFRELVFHAPHFLEHHVPGGLVGFNVSRFAHSLHSRRTSWPSWSRSPLNGRSSSWLRTRLALSEGPQTQWGRETG